MFIPDPSFFHPGSRIRIFSNPDPNSEFFPSRNPSKNLSILTQNKWFLCSQKYDPGCSTRIRILIFYPFRIPDPGVKKPPDPESGSATLVLIYLYLDQSVPLSGGKVERTVVVVRHQLYVVLESHVVSNLTDDEYIMSSFIQNKFKNVGKLNAKTTGNFIYL